MIVKKFGKIRAEIYLNGNRYHTVLWLEKKALVEYIDKDIETALNLLEERVNSMRDLV